MNNNTDIFKNLYKLKYDINVLIKDKIKLYSSNDNIIDWSIDKSKKLEYLIQELNNLIQSIEDEDFQ